MTNDERLKRQGRIFNHSGTCGTLVTIISSANRHVDGKTSNVSRQRLVSLRGLNL